MSKFKANRVTAVIKNTEANTLGIEIPREVNENEKDMYHVLYIRTKRVMTEGGIEKMTYSPIVKMYDKNVYPKIKDKSAVVGMGVPHIIHDPSLPMEASKGEDEDKKAEKPKASTSTKEPKEPKEGKGEDEVEMKYNEKKKLVKALGFEIKGTPKQEELDECINTYNAMLDTAGELGLTIVDGQTIQEIEEAIKNA